MTSALHESFLQLVRIGIGTTGDVTISKDVDWTRLKALADGQGLSAVILDALNTDGRCLADGMTLELKLKWIGEVLREYEQRYERYGKAIAGLAGFYNRHGFKMMVLKGYACSLDWPKPEHRPCGDIDIWQFGRQKNADETLLKLSRIGELENKVEVDDSHHHHTTFEWEGFTVENHYDFISVHHHRSHVALEKVLKELGQDDSHFVELRGERVYLPSPDLHALFLLKHAALHFCSTELTLRQILDWAFFVKKHGGEIDWKWLEGVLEEHGMTAFFDIVNAICVEDLGFDAGMFPSLDSLPSQKDRVLNEIFTYRYEDDLTSNLFMRQIHRFRRWYGNGWKHRLCYRESMWSAFWIGVWGHLLKPGTI